MLQPKKTKFRKTFKGRMKGNAQRGSNVGGGDGAWDERTLRPTPYGHGIQGLV